MMYAKGSGNTEEDKVWHLITNPHAGDHTVEVACGYPDMPEYPRHSGRFVPQAMTSHPGSAVCGRCSATVVSTDGC
jgi:hypothetical protein